MRKILSINSLGLFFVAAFSVPALYVSYSFSEIKSGADIKTMPSYWLGLDDDEEEEEMEEVVVTGERPNTRDSVRNLMFRMELDDEIAQREMVKNLEEKENQEEKLEEEEELTEEEQQEIIKALQEKKERLQAELDKLEEEEAEIMEEIVVEGKIDDAIARHNSVEEWFPTPIRDLVEWGVGQYFDMKDAERRKEVIEAKCAKWLGRECTPEEKEWLKAEADEFEEEEVLPIEIVPMEEIVVTGTPYEDLTTDQKLQLFDDLTIEQKMQVSYSFRERMREEQNASECATLFGQTCSSEQKEKTEELTYECWRFFGGRCSFELIEEIMRRRGEGENEQEEQGSQGTR